MFGATNPSMAALAGVAIGLVCFFAVVGTGLFVVKAARWLVSAGDTPAAPPADTRAPVQVTIPTRCACGRTAKNGKTQCGPCSRGERVTECLGGEPVGGA